MSNFYFKKNQFYFQNILVVVKSNSARINPQKLLKVSNGQIFSFVKLNLAKKNIKKGVKGSKVINLVDFEVAVYN